MAENWYALHVKSRFEKYVAGQLQQKGFDTLLPIYISRRKWSDRTKSISLPLFPGYVFCSFNINARLPIVITPGVMAILGAGRTPTPVEESQISAIRHVIKSGARVEPCSYLAVGTRVRVESGPLTGLEGFVLRIKGTERLVISIGLLMRSMAVEVDRNCVQPLPPLITSQNEFLTASRRVG
jgi:transcription antitermination factor NusG